jgi:hypothetical protein
MYIVYGDCIGASIADTMVNLIRARVTLALMRFTIVSAIEAPIEFQSTIERLLPQNVLEVLNN